MQLASILNLISGGVGTVGALLIVWGGVSLGLSLATSNGGANAADIAPALLKVVGGVIIAAAAVYFGLIDTSWAS